MDFRTAIKPLEQKGLLSHDESIMMFGSCFSDNIGRKLYDAMFDVDVNPFGTTFNPSSIYDNINYLLSGEKVCDDDLFMYNGVWNNFRYHSRFSGVKKEEVKNTMNIRLESARNNLAKSGMIFLTFGTAWYYTHLLNDTVVNNCHKIPQCEFDKRILCVEDIVADYCLLVSKLVRLNNDVKIVFTVSPVRHISDGLSENQLSKSILRVSVSEIIKKFPDSCIYFPAYEIMMDDLRDYRFYEADMVHPSETAIGYIWEVFCNSFMNEGTLNMVRKCTKLSKRLYHIPITDNEEVIGQFKKETESALYLLGKGHPYLEKIIKQRIKNELFCSRNNRDT